VEGQLGTRTSVSSQPSSHVVIVTRSLPDAVYVQGDTADPDAARRLVDTTLDRWGRLDSLVNNAGTTAVIPHHDLEAEGSPPTAGPLKGRGRPV
jgi:NAD(P)-dependent dehydrogenase (short-subunit alcohol dehydrogenase family)